MAVELNPAARVSRYPLHSNNVLNAARIWAIRRTLSPVTATCTDRVASLASTWEVAAFRTYLVLKGPRTRPRYKQILAKLCLCAPCPQDATRPQFEDLLSNCVLHFVVDAFRVQIPAPKQRPPTCFEFRASRKFNAAGLRSRRTLPSASRGFPAEALIM